MGLKNIHFKCPHCGSEWYKDKLEVIAAIKGGYHSGSGKWIQCDEEGRPIGKTKTLPSNNRLPRGKAKIPYIKNQRI